MSVLVVDDEPQLLRLLVRIFERADHEVVQARDANAAIEQIEVHGDRIDVALLDVIIPPTGVAPVLERLLALGHDVGVVLTSGDVLSPDLTERLRDCGGIFLRKPFGPDAALKALRDAISGRLEVAG